VTPAPLRIACQARRPSPLPARFHSLDALRGVAALAVVVWHWQHFFFTGTQPGVVPTEAYPFFAWLRPFYLAGGRAVELFFCLSGFIFFHLYAEKVAQRAISAREFFRLRFSRLYPLHFVTLLLVALGQTFMASWFSAPFVYAHNDAYHFVLQLLFASGWGFEHGLSFDGPAWSISVEALLYGCFFLVCFAGLRRWWHLLLFVAAGYFITWIGPFDVGRGVLSFFAGGLTCAAFHHCWRRNVPRWAVCALVAVPSALWLGALAAFPHAQLFSLSQAIHSEGGTAARVLSFALLQLTQYFNELFLFPLTLLALTLVEARRGQLFARLSFLGDWSYSTYLLHFPLQLAAVLVCDRLGWNRTVFLTPQSFLLFFAALLGLAWCSYTFLERPTQSWLRARHRGVPLAAGQ
jgi:peptidoglycan/LPS O-acetylase OafA/YrhL